METDEEMIYTLNSIIEKKDKEIKELNRMLDSERFAVIQINAIGESIKKDCFHQKYKRCMAMAKQCGSSAQLAWDHAFSFYNNQYAKRALFCEKWRNRWLKIAEKFKEAK